MWEYCLIEKAVYDCPVIVGAGLGVGRCNVLKRNML